MSESAYVGRGNFTARLQELLSADQKQKLVIQSIEGPGGIGKSSLLEHAIQGVDVGHKKYLTLKIGGNEVVGSGIFAAANKMIAAAHCDSPPPKTLSTYFTNVATVTAVHSQLHAEMQAEAAKSKNQISPDLLAAAYNAATGLGKAVNEVSPKTKEFIDFQKFGDQGPAIEEFLTNSSILAAEVPSFLEKLGLGGKTNLKNSIRANALQPLAEAMFRDLVAILSGYAKGDAFKPSHAKIKEVDRLLLIVDDYEVTGQVFGNFLLDSFLKMIAAGPFEAVVIIIGRDDIHNTSSGWDQQYGKHLKSPIRLNPLREEELNELIQNFGLDPVKEGPRAWSDTLGYPFLVKLWAEESISGGRTGTGLMRFHNRTTRWMNESQKNWLSYALLMPSINSEKFEAILGSKEEGLQAWNWFKNEGSIRNADFKVNEYLRSRLEEFLKIDDPAKHRYIRERVLLLDPDVGHRNI